MWHQHAVLNKLRAGLPDSTIFVRVVDKLSFCLYQGFFPTNLRYWAKDCMTSIGDYGIDESKLPWWLRDEGLPEESLLHPDLYEKFESTDVDEKHLVRIKENGKHHPGSWSLNKKLYHTISYGFLTMNATFAATCLTPTVEQLAEEFHVGREVGVLAASIFFIGNVVGPIIFAPMSELFGRRVSILLPVFICGIFLILTANVTSMWAVLVLRFVAGVFGSAPLVNGGGAMADMWNPQQRVGAIVLWAVFIVAGSCTGPIVGAALTTTGGYGWRWTQWTAGLYCVVVPLITVLIISETYIPVLEQSMANIMRQQFNRWQAHSKQDEVRVNLAEIFRVHLARPILLLFTPVLSLINFYSSFVYGVMFLLIESSSQEFRQVYGFPLVTSCLPDLAMLVGFIIGGMINIANSVRYGRIARKINGRPNSEEFLGALLVVGWWIMPAGCFIYGWTLYSHVHWIAPIIGLVVYGIGFAVVFQGCLIYAMDAYSHYAASTMASNTITRSVCAGVFPLFASQMYNGMNPHWASSLLGFVSLALAPAPFAFYRYGPRLRQLNPFKGVM